MSLIENIFFIILQIHTYASRASSKWRRGRDISWASFPRIVDLTFSRREVIHYTMKRIKLLLQEHTKIPL
jgi:hypothetical protein